MPRKHHSRGRAWSTPPARPPGGWLNLPSASSAHSLWRFMAICGHMGNAGHSLRIPHCLQSWQPLPQSVPDPARCPSQVPSPGTLLAPRSHTDAQVPGAQALPACEGSSSMAFPACLGDRCWETVYSLISGFKTSTGLVSEQRLLRAQAVSSLQDTLATPAFLLT